MSRRGRHIEVTKRADGDTGYRLVGGNGEVMSSSEGYTRRSDAVRAAADAFPGVDIYVEGMDGPLRDEAEVMSGPEGYPEPEGE